MIRLRHAAAVALLALGACGHHDGPPAPPLAVATADTTPGVVTAVVAPGSAVAFGLTTFAVHDELTLDSAELVGAGDGLHLAAARIAFLDCPRCRRRPGFVGVTGLLTSVCVGRFPPNSFGPTYQLAGLRLLQHDAPLTVLYLTVDGPGRYAATAVRIRYHDKRGKAHVVDETDLRFEVEQRDPKVDPDACQRPGGSIWTGGTGGVERVVPLD